MDNHQRGKAMVQLVIFEENKNLRQTLVTLLSSADDYNVAGKYANILQAKDVVQELRPDLVIMDIDTADKMCFSEITFIKEMVPDVSIILYTHFEDDDRIFKSLCAGADGYILKTTSPTGFFKALLEVRAGGALMSPAITKKLLTSFRSVSRKKQIKYDLTPREKEVMKLLIKGCSVKFIASELDIGYETARSHLKNIYGKLSVKCGKEAIAKVLAERIVF